MPGVAGEAFETVTEPDRVFRWRREELERAGYTWEAASVLAADTNVDLHEAVELLERGCAHDVALEILL